MAKTDTGYVDVGSPGSYYKLSAIDVHGNESAFTILSPAQITGVSDASTSLSVWLAPVTPNPVRETATLRFGLLRGGPASLSIYDAAGRSVRTLIQAQMASGSHETEWDGSNDAGLHVGGGLYFARLQAGGHELVARIVVIP